jgi:hypothetical protein
VFKKFWNTWAPDAIMLIFSQWQWWSIHFYWGMLPPIIVWVFFRSVTTGEYHERFLAHEKEYNEWVKEYEKNRRKKDVV